MKQKTLIEKHAKAKNFKDVADALDMLSKVPSIPQYFYQPYTPLYVSSYTPKKVRTVPVGNSSISLSKYVVENNELPKNL